MNEEQRKAFLRRVRELLGEHCVSYAVVMELPIAEDEASDAQDSVIAHSWGGTFTNARGLIERMRTQLDQDDRGLNAEEPDDDGDDWKACKK